MQTIVINNKEALIIGQMPHNGGKDSSGVPQIGQSVTLVPGVNLVDSKVLGELRKSEAFDALFKNKIMPSPAREQNPEKVGRFILVAGKEVEDKSPLAKLTEKACEAMIDETLTVAMLSNWLKEEGRGEVRRMIENKIVKLNSGSEGGPAAAAQ